MCMLYTMCNAWCLWKPEEGAGSPGIRITFGFKPPCGSWSGTQVLCKRSDVLKHHLSPALSGELPREAVLTFDSEVEAAKPIPGQRVCTTLQHHSARLVHLHHFRDDLVKNKTH